MSFLLLSKRTAELHRSLDRWSPRLLLLALLLICLSSFVLTLAYQIANIDRIGEIGFGDNYILNTVVRFQKTGVIYEPPGTSKSVPAISQYSPLLYILLSLPGHMMTAADPFLGPRLFEIGAFLLCVAVTASITHVLVPHPSAWRWSVLLALSIEPMRIWVLQLRGDFPGILFSLISIRLLLARSSRSVLLAGAAAGLATQFKFTYVSAIIAGFLWLAMERRWKNAALFAGAAMVASVGIYGIFLQREPQMLAQMFVFRHTITDYRALFGTIGSDLLREPVFLLGAAALPLVALRGWRRCWLLAGYLAVSLILSAALDLHAGGNINYFFEALFILVPLASFGALQLSRCRFGTGTLFLAGLLLFTLALPNALAAYRTIPKARSETASWNSRMKAIRAVLQGNHVLSFVPTATYLAGEPVVSEPYLLSYLERLGQIDLRPFQDRILNREFDMVVTSAQAQSWRGVALLPMGLRPAIGEAYQPFCVFEGWTIHLPRRSPRPGLAERLRSAGCADAVPGVTDRAW